MSDAPGSGSESDDQRPSPPGSGPGGSPGSPDRDPSGSAAPADPTEPTGSRRSRRRAAAAEGETPPDAAGPPSDVPPEPPTPFTQHLGRFFIVVLAVLFGIFAVANSQPVDFSWVFGETEVRDDPTGPGEIGGVPLIVLLLVTFALGALIGAFTAWQLSRSRRRRGDDG